MKESEQERVSKSTELEDKTLLRTYIYSHAHTDICPVFSKLLRTFSCIREFSRVVEQAQKSICFVLSAFILSSLPSPLCTHFLLTRLLSTETKKLIFLPKLKSLVFYTLHTRH